MNTSNLSKITAADVATLIAGNGDNNSRYVIKAISKMPGHSKITLEIRDEELGWEIVKIVSVSNQTGEFAFINVVEIPAIAAEKARRAQAVVAAALVVEVVEEAPVQAVVEAAAVIVVEEIKAEITAAPAMGLLIDLGEYRVKKAKQTKADKVAAERAALAEWNAYARACNQRRSNA